MKHSPWWFSYGFQVLAGVILVGVVLAYGFSRTINAYTWGYQRAAEEKKLAEKQTQLVVKRSVQTAIQAAIMAMQQGVDTVVKNQHVLLSQQGQLLTKATLRPKANPPRSGRISPTIPVQPIAPRKPHVEPSKSWWPFSLQQSPTHSPTLQLARDNQDPIEAILTSNFYQP